ncbi:MAG: alpha/beta fold hydrolase [Candidatus Binatia bacterium]
MLNLMQHLMTSWSDGAIRLYDGLRRGASESFPTWEDPPPVTPFTVVAEYGKLRLRYYGAQGAASPTPLFLIYALVKRPFILDFQPRRSVIETLVSHGFNVYLTDWLPPSSVDAWRGLDAYVNQDLVQAVRYIRQREQTDQVTVLGYCLGGVLGAVYTALYPTTVRQFLALALPLDLSIREIPAYTLSAGLSPETITLVTTTYGNCPAWLVHAGFTAMAPVHHAVGKYVDLYRQRVRHGYAETFALFERWMHSDVPLAGQLFRELSLSLFRENQLLSGQLRVGPHRVNLERISCPVLNIIGQHDDVVHPDSSLPLLDHISSRDKENLCFPVGHMGLAVSSAAHKELWPQVCRWLAARGDSARAEVLH